MKWSLYLGRVAGIRLFMHWTFLILVAWIFFVYYRVSKDVGAGLNGVLFILAIFACVVLHELGHALTARRYGIVTRRITLLPIGGLAQMEKLPDKPMQEFAVAIAGPLVNLGIAAVLFVIINATTGFPTLEELAATRSITAANFVFNLFAANMVLAVFNLLPAFPMDGGRMARALLSLRMDRARATRIAASVGQLLAIGFVVLGLSGNFWLAFIGIFIYLGAGAESEYEAARFSLRGYKVRDVLMTRYVTLSQDDSLELAVDRLLEGEEKEFIVTHNGEVTGILTRNEIIKGLHAYGRQGPVDKVMQREFLRLDPEMELQTVFEKMTLGKTSVAPVFEGDRLVGTLDRENISEFLLVKKALES